MENRTNGEPREPGQMENRTRVAKHYIPPVHFLFGLTFIVFFRFLLLCKHEFLNLPVLIYTPLFILYLG